MDYHYTDTNEAEWRGVIVTLTPMKLTEKGWGYYTDTNQAGSVVITLIELTRVGEGGYLYAYINEAGWEWVLSPCQMPPRGLLGGGP